MLRMNKSLKKFKDLFKKIYKDISCLKIKFKYINLYYKDNGCGEIGRRARFRS